MDELDRAQNIKRVSGTLHSLDGCIRDLERRESGIDTYADNLQIMSVKFARMASGTDRYLTRTYLIGTAVGHDKRLPRETKDKFLRLSRELHAVVQIGNANDPNGIRRGLITELTAISVAFHATIKYLTGNSVSDVDALHK